PRPLALAVVLRVAEGQLHRNRLLGSLIDCGRSRWIVQSFLRKLRKKKSHDAMQSYLLRMFRTHISGVLKAELIWQRKIYPKALAGC
ncbi:hypothetical protein J7371_13035, partial [Xanthomonas phaseoli pv. dieffenbachiae]